MALRAETLARIGGFAPLLGVLADDHALGMAVRRLGLRVEVSPVLPAHVMSESSLAALWAHELRWARTVRLLNPRGFLGLGLTHPLPWALLALLCATGAATLAVLGLVLAARLALATGADAATGAAGGLSRLAWLPIRDLLSAAIWATALRHGGVDWQGRRYALSAEGLMSEAPPARSEPS
jgi:ceramide glucosyltransferase